jgi:hypothetical protein
MSQGPLKVPESPAPLELPLEPELLPEPLLEPELLPELEPPLEPELFEPPLDEPLLEPELPEPPLDPELAVPLLDPELLPELEELPGPAPPSSPLPEWGPDVSVEPHAQKIAVADKAAKRPRTHVRLLVRTCGQWLVVCPMPSCSDDGSALPSENAHQPNPIA